MILCTLARLIAAQHTWMRPEVSEWLNSLTKDIAQGRHNIDASDYANVESPALRTRDDAPLEAHRRYIDIHIPLDSTETIGWAPMDTLTRTIAPGYDAERDIAFYGDEAHTYFEVRPGECAIFFPEDAHAPNIGSPSKTHRKICVKIAVDTSD